MKILANDGLSQSGIDVLTEASFEVITTNIAQEQLIPYINDHKITVLLNIYISAKCLACVI